jgi:hypothetical protein
LGWGTAIAQVNTAKLSGQVTDPQGLAVRGAKLSATNLATDTERSATSDEEGRYAFLNLVPGDYKVHVEGGANFAPYETPSLQVKVGQEAVLNVRLELGTQSQTIIRTPKRHPSKRRLPNRPTRSTRNRSTTFPINGRNYINFTF